MTNPFRDQEKFMRACDQSVEGFDKDQFALYYNLIGEEFEELTEAHSAGDRVEMLDAQIGRAHV